ncbi:hypothetical protein CHS0354_030654 [Potamilus streckersoni]|uniref:Uncharacterized protein n=1 Tax=Potamilus streckersoni TaxID=2493646 RepID=A0AAE0VM14_9BIVA|nr:hypothetical protein CHS0354_030654 [Potamilus streckersoni]
METSRSNHCHTTKLAHMNRFKKRILPSKHQNNGQIRQLYVLHHKPHPPTDKINRKGQAQSKGRDRAARPTAPQTSSPNGKASAKAEQPRAPSKSTSTTGQDLTIQASIAVAVNTGHQNTTDATNYRPEGDFNRYKSREGRFRRLVSSSLSVFSAL